MRRRPEGRTSGAANCTVSHSTTSSPGGFFRNPGGPTRRPIENGGIPWRSPGEVPVAALVNRLGWMITLRARCRRAGPRCRRRAAAKSRHRCGRTERSPVAAQRDAEQAHSTTRTSVLWVTTRPARRDGASRCVARPRHLAARPPGGFVCRQGFAAGSAAKCRDLAAPLACGACRADRYRALLPTVHRKRGPGVPGVVLSWAMSSRLAARAAARSSSRSSSWRRRSRICRSRWAWCASAACW